MYIVCIYFMWCLIFNVLVVFIIKCNLNIELKLIRVKVSMAMSCYQSYHVTDEQSITKTSDEAQVLCYDQDKAVTPTYTYLVSVELLKH